MERGRGRVRDGVTEVQRDRERQKARGRGMCATERKKDN